ncbi:hypothetical protein ABIB82_001815 [Bradyrhizobium sp. i1.8.4]|uniref:hypothetical protein n=1 Tax=unclassified Bradyrhizobium TaxID=2631580 RepID=UPI003D1C304C
MRFRKMMEPMMSVNKCLLAFSILAPLVVASATAQAGLTASDRRYLPNEVAETAPAGGVAAQRDPMSAFGYDQGAVRLEPMNVPHAAAAAGTPWRYHGGPKSQ